MRTRDLSSGFTRNAVRLVLACAVALAGCDSQNSGGQAVAPPPPEVGVVEIRTEAVPITTELPGRTSPHLIAEVRPQVDGIIQKRLFREGSYVKAGDVLYQIDPATYQAAYDSAKAALARAEASLASARLKEKRFRELMDAKVVSRQAYDDAKAALDQAEADVAAAKAAVEAARINLAYTRITAPISGRVGRSTVTPGALVTANQAAALVTVQQLDPMYVDVVQSSAELLRLRRELESGRLKSAGPGRASVRLRLEDGSEYAHEGTLQFTDVTVDESTGAVTLRAVFPNPKGELLPGMYVRAILQQGVAEQAILVPQQGVSRDPRGNAIALVVGDDGTVEQRTLEVSRAIGDKWLVTAGLRPGDRVIVEGLQRARPGSVVTPVPAGGEPASGTPGETPPKAGTAAR
ncbi:MAG TPA: efflux RND transporter periplasmic adaptor subunit [Thermodesulfobacteriota bacterium]